MIFHALLEKAEDGWIVAEVPALPGCVSQGKDEKEALENIKNHNCLALGRRQKGSSVVAQKAQTQANSSGGLA